MTAEQLTWLIQNWDKVGVSLLLFLFVVGAGFLFFTDRLASPKTLGKLNGRIEELEAECKAKDAIADKASEALVEARILYTKASAKLEFLEQDHQRLHLDATECRRQLETVRLEVQARERWGFSPPSGPKTEGQS